MRTTHPKLIPNGAVVTDEASALVGEFASGRMPAERLRLLSLADAAAIVPLSEKTLRRAAQRHGAPFLKVENCWMVYENELHEWVRERARAAAEDSPAPRRRRRKRAPVDSMAAVLAEEPA